MASKRRSYTAEFKQEAVRLVREEGMSYADVGADLGIDRSIIRDWCKKAETGTLDGSKASPAQMSVEEELARLRREVRILREEREILKKAAASFARETR
jgi:transposase